MSVDWITVAAQLVNFLVLVWLLKRFLYRPILDGVDAREAEIAERMSEASRAREKAEIAEARHNDEITTFRINEASMIDSQRQEAEAERDTLLTEARARLEQERKDWDARLSQEKRRYIARLHRSGAASLVSLTGKALVDLSDETLEERVVAHVARQLKPMAADLRKMADDGTTAVVTTRHVLPDAARAKLVAEMKNLIPEQKLQFETDPEQPTGLILRMGAVHVAWTVDSYIEGLDALLEEHLLHHPEMKVGTDGH
jgi:F-type H+-transporting ATPase subunit b